MKNTTDKMSLFRLNISSFCFYIEEPTSLSISEHDLAFDIIEISESWLKLNKAPPNSPQISFINNLFKESKIFKISDFLVIFFISLRNKLLIMELTL